VEVTDSNLPSGSLVRDYRLRFVSGCRYPVLVALWERFPFPAEHAVAILTGSALQACTPRRRLPRGFAPAGWLVLAAGVGLNAWAVNARGGGDLEAPDRLVQTGPHALTRNPMYVGWSLLHLGTGIVVRSPWVLAMWPVAFALVHRAVLREERLLKARFGDEFVNYAELVNRYLPTLGSRL
jgi:protein-S-isoprenylcysteine O-methyltransferase Ste14